MIVEGIMGIASVLDMSHGLSDGQSIGQSENDEEPDDGFGKIFDREVERLRREEDGKRRNDMRKL